MPTAVTVGSPHHCSQIDESFAQIYQMIVCPGCVVVVRAGGLWHSNPQFDLHIPEHQVPVVMLACHHLLSISPVNWLSNQLANDNRFVKHVLILIELESK